MFDWLKKAGQAAVNFGAEFLQFQKDINQLVELPVDDMLVQLEALVVPMEKSSYTSFSSALAALYMAAKANVQALAPEHAPAQEALRPAELPQDDKPRQAVIRLRKLEMLSSYSDAYRKGDKPDLPEAAADAPAVPSVMIVPKEDIPGVVAHLYAQLEGLTVEQIEAVEPAFKAKLNAMIEGAKQSDDPEVMDVLFQAINKHTGAIFAQTPDYPGHDMMTAFKDVYEVVSKAPPDDPLERAARYSKIEGSIQLAGKLSAKLVPTDLVEADPHSRLVIPLIEAMGADIRGIGTNFSFGDKEDEAVDDLIQKFDYGAQQVAKANPSEFMSIEVNTFRRAAAQWRAFQIRQHLTLAYPAFPRTAIKSDPNAVFYSGGTELLELLARICEVNQLTIAAAEYQTSAVQKRWDALRSSAVAVFDFTSYDPARSDPSTIDPAQEAQVLAAAGALAGVAYELGWAYALGIPLVIVANEGQRVPFDVDIEPVWLGGAHDAQRLEAALQQAIYRPQRASGGSTMEATLAFVEGHYADHPLVGSLDKPVYREDALALRHALQAFVNSLQDENPILITPAFPGDYPDEANPQLFYVTAFREWAKAAQKITQGACEAAGVHYQIGYDRLDPDIIGIIWTDICRASYVVVDITNLNPNAVQELGMAQVLGRKTLIITQNKNPHAHFPAIAKTRTHFYDPNSAGSMEDLEQLLGRFLADEV